MKHLTASFSVLCMWDVLPCAEGALTVQEAAVVQRVCNEFPPSANCLG